MALCSVAASPADIAASKAAIRWRWGIEIIASDLQTRIAPEVTTQQRPVTLADLSEQNAPACRAAVQTALGAYPAAFVSGLVHRVVLADGIHAWDIRIGGFHAPGLLAANCESAVDNERFDVDSIHDSIGALLLARTPLDPAAWSQFNPPGFRYGDVASYKAELRDPGSRDGTAALHRSGFVASLGLTGIENDFETYAEKVFGHPKHLAEMMSANAAMRGKARLLMSMYLRQSPWFARRFEAIDPARAAKAE